VVNPDDVIERFGADCLRMFEMFLGPIEQSKPWDDKGINGVSNFLRKFWRLFYSETNGWQVINEEPTPAEYKAVHKTIKKVTEDIERLSYNTAVSAFMIGVNELTALNCHKHKILEPLSVLIAPFAPFMAEELWHALGNASDESIHSHAKYPLVNEQYLTESSFDYPVSVNGKVRANLTLPLDLPAEEVQQQTLHHETIQKWTNGAVPKKFIFVKGKIINVVV
jgi:leucyl-tRNA synthetase